MERTHIVDLSAHVGKEVTINGWVDVRRDHGKLIFFDIRDGSGKAQVVVLPNHPEALAQAQELRAEWVVAIQGIVNKRPEKMVAPGTNGDIEIEATAITVFSKATEIPFDKDVEVNLDTNFDNRPYTLRSQRARDIFMVQATILNAYRNSLRNQQFTEFQAPALVGGDAEGGGEVFRVEYFADQTAYLATSPQLYKQIMVGAFERVFTIARVFRAEKSSTTRHLSELTQMDFEMGFIKDEMDVIAALERVIREVVTEVGKTQGNILERFGTTAPALGQKFPILTLREAQKILEVAEEPDLEPDHERRISEWALKEHGSDFVFITKFPTTKRAFYTYEEPTEAPYSRGFDLLFRGLEINSGAQRIHNYDDLVRKIESRGMDPKKFSFYLQTFKYGMPPHGGCSTGLERFTARMLNLPNVKEAIPFPRDMNRIDTLLHGSNAAQS